MPTNKKTKTATTSKRRAKVKKLDTNRGMSVSEAMKVKGGSLNTASNQGTSYSTIKFKY